MLYDYAPLDLPPCGLELLAAEDAASELRLQLGKFAAVNFGIGVTTQVSRGDTPPQQRRQQEQQGRRAEERGDRPEQDHRGASPGPSTRSARRCSSGASAGSSAVLRRRRSTNTSPPAAPISRAKGPIQSSAVVALKGGS